MAHRHASMALCDSYGQALAPCVARTSTQLPYWMHMRHTEVTHNYLMFMHRDWMHTWNGWMHTQNHSYTCTHALLRLCQQVIVDCLLSTSGSCDRWGLTQIAEGRDDRRGGGGGSGGSSPATVPERPPLRRARTTVGVTVGGEDELGTAGHCGSGTAVSHARPRSDGLFPRWGRF